MRRRVVDVEEDPPYTRNTPWFLNPGHSHQFVTGGGCEKFLSICHTNTILSHKACCGLKPETSCHNLRSLFRFPWSNSSCSVSTFIAVIYYQQDVKSGITLAKKDKQVWHGEQYITAQQESAKQLWCCTERSTAKYIVSKGSVLLHRASNLLHRDWSMYIYVYIYTCCTKTEVYICIYNCGTKTGSTQTGRDLSQSRERNGER